ncbi:alpha/beta hydrolase [Candidatus Aquicultor secundus]|uniref:alpha/beta hydrolase n=1 Tax=Candidatus Aquicultor secundus TaxID=1973895 RepID=UPI000CB5F582|nr:alpha/beta hydrolase [Candidatus Aquicultor secundus]PIY37927.1 MAG: dienelactone hydrolase [Candidatus Aquicultor secundus]
MEEKDEARSRVPLIREVTWGKSEDGYEPITLVTGRRDIRCRYYPVAGTLFGAIWVGGVGGDWDTPARGLYPYLCDGLRNDNIASLRVRFSFPTNLEESVYDVLAGISFFESQGIVRMALTGHSFGGAVVIQAAARSDSVKTVVALSTQAYGVDVVPELSPDCSILLIHGDQDTVVPSTSSHRVYTMAHEPKKLVILKGTGHNLDKSAREVEQIVHDWIIEKLSAQASAA